MTIKLQRFFLLKVYVLTMIHVSTTYICRFQLKGLLFRIHHRMFLNISAWSCYPDDLQEKDQLDHANISNNNQKRSRQLQFLEPGAAIVLNHKTSGHDGKLLTLARSRSWGRIKKRVASQEFFIDYLLIGEILLIVFCTVIVYSVKRISAVWWMVTYQCLNFERNRSTNQVWATDLYTVPQMRILAWSKF